MVNEDFIPIELTNSQIEGLSRLQHVFEYGVSQLIKESYDVCVVVSDYQTKLIKAKRNVLVQFSFDYRDQHYVLLSLLRNDGVYFLPDGSRPLCPIDLIFVYE